jgi:hypothetical protein
MQSTRHRLWTLIGVIYARPNQELRKNIQHFWWYKIYLYNHGKFDHYAPMFVNHFFHCWCTLIYKRSFVSHLFLWYFVHYNW